MNAAAVLGESQDQRLPSSADVLLCPGCGAIVDVGPGEATTTCVYCATPGVISRPRGQTLAPELITPFVVGRGEAIVAAKSWLRSRSIFAHSGIKNAPIEHMRGVYVPAWLYSCVARSNYTARIGENYTVTETYTTTVNGKPTKMPVIQALITKLMATALGGNHAAMKLAFELYNGAHPPVNDNSPLTTGSSFELTPEDLAAIAKSTLLKGIK